MTILGALAMIFLGALLLAGFRQRASQRSGGGPLGLGLGNSTSNGAHGKQA